MKKGMKFMEEDGSVWVVLDCDDLHNVHLIKLGKGLLISVDGKDIECGGSELACYVEDCEEFKNNPPTFLINNRK